MYLQDIMLFRCLFCLLLNSDGDVCNQVTVFWCNNIIPKD